MSRSFQPKNQPRSCESYINTIADLRAKIQRMEVLHEVSDEIYKQELLFLRWTIAVSLGLGFVIGVILSKGFSL